jgi:hypothetical protein
LATIYTSRAAACPLHDVAILNFALTLEYLESAFYASALRHEGLTGEWKRLATTVHQHEKAHVEALRKALGSAAVKRPNFDSSWSLPRLRERGAIGVDCGHGSVAGCTTEAVHLIAWRPRTHAFR